jgi:hypothetical protein
MSSKTNNMKGILRLTDEIIQTPESIKNQEELKKQENPKLYNNFTIWGHFTNEWTPESYINIYKFNTIKQFWSILNKINEIYKNGNIYLMKEDIKPLWENNVDGKRYSFKISVKESSFIWLELCMSFIGNYLLKENLDCISGIEFQKNRPKNMSIIKIWVKDNTELKFNVNFLNKYKLIIQENQTFSKSL